MKFSTFLEILGLLNLLLVLCTLSVQLSQAENKDDVIRRLADMTTKAQLEDKNYLDNLVKTVNNNELNVTTKVSLVFS